jgi:tetratricopeptide (TPR) repeat protein
VHSNPTVTSSSSLLIDHYECGLKQESLEQYESAILHYKKFLSSLSRVSNRDTIKRCVTLRRIGVCSSYLVEEGTGGGGGGGGGVSLSSPSSNSRSELGQDTALVFLNSSLEEAKNAVVIANNEEEEGEGLSRISSSLEAYIEVERSTTELGNYMMFKYENNIINKLHYLDQAAMYYMDSNELARKILECYKSPSLKTLNDDDESQEDVKRRRRKGKDEGMNEEDDYPKEFRLDAAARASYNLARSLNHVHANKKAIKLLQDAIFFSGQINDGNNNSSNNNNNNNDTDTDLGHQTSPVVDRGGGGLELRMQRCELRLGYFKLLGDIQMKTKEYDEAAQSFSQALLLLDSLTQMKHDDDGGNNDDDDHNGNETNETKVYEGFDLWPKGELLFKLSLARILNIKHHHQHHHDIGSFEDSVRSAKTSITRFQDEIEHDHIKLNSFMTRRVKELNKELRSAELFDEVEDDDYDHEGDDSEAVKFDDDDVHIDTMRDDDDDDDDDMINQVKNYKNSETWEEGENKLMIKDKKKNQKVELNMDDFKFINNVSDQQRPQGEGSHTMDREGDLLTSDKQRIDHHHESKGSGGSKVTNNRPKSVIIKKKKVLLKQSSSNHYVITTHNMNSGILTTVNNTTTYPSSSVHLISKQSGALRKHMSSTTKTSTNSSGSSGGGGGGGGLKKRAQSPPTTFSRLCSWQRKSTSSLIPIEIDMTSTSDVGRTDTTVPYPSLLDDSWKDIPQVLSNIAKIHRETIDNENEDTC